VLVLIRSQQPGAASRRLRRLLMAQELGCSIVNHFMPIYRLLKNSAFEPQHVTAMTTAFEEICRELELAEREDPLRDIVARAIVACAQKGELDPIRLRECARKALHS
jgi:hypothetical protein